MTEKKTKKTILIVDDDSAYLANIKKEITDRGYGVLTASDGEEGVSVALKEHPDLIVLDTLLPYVSGPDALKQLRADKWGAEVPVIVVTQVEFMGNVAQTVSKGVVGYLVKGDWSISELADKIIEKIK